MEIKPQGLGTPDWLSHGLWGILALLCLIGGGLVARSPEVAALMDRPVNPLALRSSPFGMLLSSLLQQPMNVAWHKGIETSHGAGDHKDDHDEEVEHEPEHAASKDDHHGHHHAAGEHCEECDKAAGRFRRATTDEALLGMPLDALAYLYKVSATRTNPKPISNAHKQYIARDIEKKMLVAYNLDPTNYAAYDAYFLFLTTNPVSGLGNESQLKQAQKITENTLALSNAELENPLPTLTAALAVYNHFMLALARGVPRDVAANRALSIKMKNYLVRYQHLKSRAENDGNWWEAPEAWRLQADERAIFLAKIAEGLAGNRTNEAPKI